RENDVGVAGPDRLSSEHHRLEAGTADLVYGQGRDGVWQTGLECRLSSGILSQAGLNHVADVDFVDVFGCEIGAAQGFLEGDGAQVGSGQVCEGAEVLTDRGTGSGD